MESGWCCDRRVVGPLLDLLLGTDSFAPLPHSEVIITTMITKTGAILASNTTPYDINDKDRQHYWDRPDTLGREARKHLSSIKCIPSSMDNSTRRHERCGHAI